VTGYAIEADDLTRHFGAVRAVDGLRLRVPAGSVFGFLGPNGAGKTTTLQMLLGILAPTRGDALVAGASVRGEPDLVRRRCGALLEHHGLYERLSAAQNLDFHGQLHGLPAPDRAERVRATLEGMGLWERRGNRVGTWSRGMKQRLAIGRALLHRPQVLFLDEPTAGFDPAAAAALRKEVRALARDQGITVFLTTHNLHEAEEVCDQVGVLRSGRLLAVGPPGSLRADPLPRLEVQVRKPKAGLVEALRRRKGVAAVEAAEGGTLLRVDLADAAGVPALVKALVAAGAEVEEVRRHKPTLEESFLAILEGR
jgi:ABC-2 type transport system ATP-binding protein